MKLVVISIILLMLLSMIAFADPIITKQSYVMGPYNISFDLIGIRDIEPSIKVAEAFQVEISDGVRYELSLSDNNTEESVDIGILRYKQPVAKGFEDSSNKHAMVDMPLSTNIVDRGTHGYSWVVPYSAFTGSYSTEKSINDYTLIFIDSTLSWKATEKLLETFYVDFDPTKTVNESIKPIEPLDELVV